MEAGFDSIVKILNMKVEDFLKVEGFKDKTSNKLYNGIREKIKVASLVQIMAASNLFGRGFSEKKLELIINSYPEVLLSNESVIEYKKSISDKELNDVLGDPKVLIGLIKKELAEDFFFNRFEDTRFYKFWKERMKNEKLYIKGCKTATIGDMKYLKIRTQSIELMLNVIKARANNLTPGCLIDLDVEGFTFEYITNNEEDSDDEERDEVRTVQTIGDDD
jgi:hypothetical protein